MNKKMPKQSQSNSTIPNLEIERKLFSQGIKYIAGVDEVGRGPLAGPIVACAVILDMERVLSLSDASDPTHNLYTQIKDSKMLTPIKRARVNEFLLNESISYSLYEISNEDIDKKGISAANQDAFFNSLMGLDVKAQIVLTDHFEISRITKESQMNITQGDKVSISIAAASIIAKVYRDSLMVGMSKLYPQYRFEKHKGYGTAEHIQLLKIHGPCKIHRFSFEPVKSMFQ